MCLRIVDDRLGKVFVRIFVGEGVVVGSVKGFLMWSFLEFEDVLLL